VGNLLSMENLQTHSLLKYQKKKKKNDTNSSQNINIVSK